MTAIGYLLDENVDPRLRRAVTSRVPDLRVWCIGDPGAPPLYADDPTILAWCEANGFILVTNTWTSMPGDLGDHLAGGRHVSRIFILHPAMTLGETADELALIGLASRADECADLIRFLPLSR